MQACVPFPVFSSAFVTWLIFQTTSNQPSATMLVKVKTLTGKEIEIDIDPTDKVRFIVAIDCWVFLEPKTLN